MKLIDNQKEKSWRDKIGDKQLYACPYCKSEGYEVASITVSVSHTAPLVRRGRVLIGKDKDKELTCPQCSKIVARLIKGEWVMIGIT